MDIAPGCTFRIIIGLLSGNMISDVLLHDDEPEWAQEQDAIQAKS
jgi:hypothetical protein